MLLQLAVLLATSEVITTVFFKIVTTPQMERNQ